MAQPARLNGNPNALSLPQGPPPDRSEVGGSVFTDAARLSLGWYWLLPSSELKPGVKRGFEFWGKQLVLFRTTSGKLAALPAYCRHMNNNMAVFGEVRGETLRCGYHGWKYDTDGKCPRASGRLASYPVVERYGMIWLWPSDSVPPATEFPFAGVVSDYARCRRKVYQLPCHPLWTTVNAADGTHFSHIHGLKQLKFVANRAVNNGMFLQHWRIMLRDRSGAYYRPLLMKAIEHVLGLQLRFSKKTLSKDIGEEDIYVDNFMYLGDGCNIYEKMSFHGFPIWEAVIAPSPRGTGCEFLYCFLSDAFFIRYLLGRLIIAQGIREDMPIFVGNAGTMPELADLMPGEDAVRIVKNELSGRPHIVRGKW